MSKIKSIHVIFGFIAVTFSSSVFAGANVLPIKGGQISIPMEHYAVITCQETFSNAPSVNKITMNFPMASGESYPNYLKLPLIDPGKFSYLFKTCNQVGGSSYLINQSAATVSAFENARVGGTPCLKSSQCASGKCNLSTNACEAVINPNNENPR